MASDVATVLAAQLQRVDIRAPFGFQAQRHLKAGILQAGGQADMGHILVDSNGGNISIQGGHASQTNDPGVHIYNTSTINAGTGNVSITGNSYGNPGVQLAGSTNGLTTVTGNQVSISGQTSMGSTGLMMDTADVTAIGGLNITATNGGLLLKTSKVSNSGSGPTTLTTSSNGTVGLTIDANSSVSATASEIQLTTDRIQLDGTVNAGLNNHQLKLVGLN